MKLIIFLSIIFKIILNVTASDVLYSVVAFPNDKQSISVLVGGKSVPLQRSNLHENLFSGLAPFDETYRYAVTEGSTNTPEAANRKLISGSKSTGNDFFNRSQTVYDIPALPQAFNPIYPTLFTGLNKSNEIATIIMKVNASQLDEINKNPTQKSSPVSVSQFTYISNKEIIAFNNVGLSTSGQSTKDFSKQSYAIDFNKFTEKGSPKRLMFGRTSLKLRAEETDSTFIREKLTLDMLAASGAATLSGSWVRVFVNNEPYGLYLLMDDLSTHFIDAVLHAGNFQNPTTGVTYKGNAISPTQEGNLAYIGDDEANYSSDLYKLSDTGEDKTIFKSNNSQKLIVDFIKRLNHTKVEEATNIQHPGDIVHLIDPQHTLIHMAINFLIGSWDGFWYQASNYYLHNDLSSNQWILITYDFDETFGNYLEDRTLNTVAYKSYARPGSKRPLVNVFLDNPYYDSVFQDTLKTIVKRFFKPDIINPRLKAWSSMLESEIIWTRSINGHSPGTKTAYTLKDFQDSSIGNATDSISLWVFNRAESLTRQLSFTDKDDLPPLPPYTQGTYLDDKGKVTHSNGSLSYDGNHVSASSGMKSCPPVFLSGLVLIIMLICL